MRMRLCGFVCAWSVSVYAHWYGGQKKRANDDARFARHWSMDRMMLGMRCGTAKRKMAEQNPRTERILGIGGQTAWKAHKGPRLYYYYKLNFQSNNNCWFMLEEDFFDFRSRFTNKKITEYRISAISTWNECVRVWVLSVFYFGRKPVARGPEIWFWTRSFRRLAISWKLFRNATATVLLLMLSIWHIFDLIFCSTHPAGGSSIMHALFTCLVRHGQRILLALRQGTKRTGREEKYIISSLRGKNKRSPPKI